MFATRLALVFFAATALPCLADVLPQPKGPVILQVTGELALTNGYNSASFDEQMLRELGETSFKTSTVWTDGTPLFTGISLYDLVKKLGIKADHLNLIAVNDYKVEVPISDAVKDGPILAYAMDGKPMSLRDKGPIWLIYPFDSKADYRSETIYARSIWQLEKIDLVN